MENAIRIFYIFGYVNSKREIFWISRLPIEIALHVEIICRYCTAATLQYIDIRFSETELNRNYIYLRNVPQYICNNAITILHKQFIHFVTNKILPRGLNKQRKCSSRKYFRLNHPQASSLIFAR